MDPQFWHFRAPPEQVPARSPLEGEGGGERGRGRDLTTPVTFSQHTFAELADPWKPQRTVHAPSPCWRLNLTGFAGTLHNTL